MKDEFIVRLRAEASWEAITVFCLRGEEDGKGVFQTADLWKVEIPERSGGIRFLESREKSRTALGVKSENEFGVGGFDLWHSSDN